MKTFRLNVKKVFGDYFFLVLLLLGIGINYYFEMKVNRSIKRYAANHESILEYKALESQIRDLGDEIRIHEQSVRALLMAKDTSTLAKIREQENRINRNAIVLTQRIHDIASVDHLVNFRETIQSKLEFEHQVIATSIVNKDGALKMVSSDKLFALHDLYDQHSSLLSKDITTLIEIKNSQSKADKVDIIALDYAIPHLTSFIFLVFAAFTVFKIFQVSRLNKYLNEAMANEKKAQDVKDQFMDTMTHELRSPLNSVLGYTNLLLKTKLDQDQSKYIKSIKTSGELLLNVINEVLDYSKIRSGYIMIASSPFRFREQMSALADILRDKVNEKGLEFNCKISDDIPDDLRGDSVKLLQVLLNLTYNAVKFTNNGSIEVNAFCKERSNSRVLLQIDVTDTGIGMPEDKLPRIFERFYQVEASGSRNLAGTGLGLSITKEMLIMQGGSITVESEVGKGSVFHVIIPYEVIDEQETLITSAVKASNVRTLPSSMRVLAVDDNQLNREMLAVMLKGYGISFNIARSGPEAIRILKDTTFDVVLMDLQMPGMDGKMATQKIREELKSDVPIIALSAYAEVAEKQNCLAAGMDAYLSKPIREEELYETLEIYSPQHEDKGGGLDLDYLRKVSSGNTEFIESVVMRVADTLPKEIAEMGEALIANDQEKVNIMAHDMKTTFAVLGVYEMVEEALGYLESWKSSPKTMTIAGEMFHLIENVSQEVVQQLVEAFTKADN